MKPETRGVRRHSYHERLVTLTQGSNEQVRTPFGRVQLAGRTAVIYATPEEVYRWARRPGAEWPCSSLLRATNWRGVGLRVEIYRGDVCDVSPAMRDIDGVEFDAWADDVLAAALEAMEG